MLKSLLGFAQTGCSGSLPAGGPVVHVCGTRVQRCSPGVGGSVCMGWKFDILLFEAPFGAYLVAQMVKNLPAVWEAQVQSPGRFPGEGNGSPLQYSCLENSMDRGVWRATGHRVAKSRTHLNS